MSTFSEETGIRYEDLTKDLQEMFKPKFTYDDLHDLENRLMRIKQLLGDVRVTIAPSKPTDPKPLKELYVDPSLPQPYMYTEDNRWVPITMVPVDVSDDDVTCKVNIIQTDKQRVVVIVDGKEYQETFNSILGKKYTTRVYATDDRYMPGTLVNMPASGMFLGDSVFKLSDAVPKQLSSNKEYHQYTNHSNIAYNEAVFVETWFDNATDITLDINTEIWLGYNGYKSGPYNSFYNFEVRVNNVPIWESGRRNGADPYFAPIMTPTQYKNFHVGTFKTKVPSGKVRVSLWVWQQDVRNKHCDTNIRKFTVDFK